MFSFSQTRDSARAVVFAALTGSAVGLLFTAGYLGGGLPRGAAQDISAPVQAAPIAAAEAAAPAGTNASAAAPVPVVKVNYAGPAAQPFRASHGQTDLDCLTEAVYYEARGEGRAGQEAVAQVVLNRVRHPAFPRSVCAVVFQGCQFSFACDGSMAARRNVRAWDRARKIAAEALSGAVMANVGNATHFHTANVSPNWGPGLVRVGQVGLHVFYRFAGRNGRPGAFNEEGVPSAPEPGQYEYRRLTPDERIYLTAAVLKMPPKIALNTDAPKAGVGGPLGPVQEPASAPAATPAAPKAPAQADAAKPAAATAVKPIKASADAPVTTAKTPAVAAS